MARADLVFTSGKSLYEAKSLLHPQVHCFPSSVDLAHFEKALNGIAVASDVAALHGPAIGYYGGD